MYFDTIWSKSKTLKWLNLYKILVFQRSAWR